MKERAEVKNGRISTLNRADRSIVLVGMRGSGKTTIGSLLAETIGRRFVDLDGLLEERMRKKIPEIIDKDKWGYFRDRESEVVHAVSSSQRLVMATGGGAILRPSNINALRSNGLIVYLDTPIPNLCDHIGDDPNRPPLTDAGSLEEDLKRTYQVRSGIYEYVSDMAFGNESHTPQTLTRTIFYYLRRDRYV